MTEQHNQASAGRDENRGAATAARLHHPAPAIQSFLQPDWVNIPQPGLVAIGNCHPGSTLPGDSYDVIPLTDGNCFFLAARIDGAGVTPAIQAGAVQALARNLIGNSGEIPVELLLGELKERFRALFGGKFRLKCAGAIIDLAHNRLRYCNAGLPELFLIDSRGNKTADLGGHAAGGEIPFQPGMTLLASTVEVSAESLRNFAANTGSPELAAYSLEPADADSRDGALIVGLHRPATQGLRHSSHLTATQNFQRIISVATDLAREVESVTKDRLLAMKIELVLNEFLNNILIHGYRRELRLTPKILIRQTIEEDRIEIAFFDRGVEWNYAPPAQSLAEVDRQDCFRFDLDVGRGMLIISEIAKKIERTRHGALNMTVFTIPC